MLSRFHLIPVPERHGGTDRQTDRQTDGWIETVDQNTYK